MEVNYLGLNYKCSAPWVVRRLGSLDHIQHIEHLHSISLRLYKQLALVLALVACPCACPCACPYACPCRSQSSRHPPLTLTLSTRLRPSASRPSSSSPSSSTRFPSPSTGPGGCPSWLPGCLPRHLPRRLPSRLPSRLLYRPFCCSERLCSGMTRKLPSRDVMTLPDAS